MLAAREKLRLAGTALDVEARVPAPIHFSGLKRPVDKSDASALSGAKLKKFIQEFRFYALAGLSPASGCLISSALFLPFLSEPGHWENVSFTRLKSDLAILEFTDVGLKSVELNADEQHIDVGSAC